MKRVIALLFATFLFGASNPSTFEAVPTFEYDIQTIGDEDPSYMEILVSARDQENLITYYAPQGKNIVLTKSSVKLLDDKLEGITKDDAKLIILVCDDISLSPNPKIAKKICKKIKWYIVKQYNYPKNKVQILMVDYD